jgi:hypothetical protein
LLEAVVNLSVGYVVAVGANMVVLPLFGFFPSLEQHALIGLIFSVLSLVRSYSLRRAFNWWADRGRW